MDNDFKNFIDVMQQGSFLTNLTKIFVSDFDTRLRFTFNMYDFDNDGLISHEDVQMVLYDIFIDLSYQMATSKANESNNPDPNPISTMMSAWKNLPKQTSPTQQEVTSFNGNFEQWFATDE